MTDAVYNWKVWCITDGKWEYVWSPTKPTNCPENSGHTIDPDKTSVEETVTKQFPKSEIGDKIAVHSSPKPETPGKFFYAVWTGAGDTIGGTPGLGDGDLLDFELTPGTPSVTKLAKFDPAFGSIYIHEAYLRFENAGPGDYISAYVVGSATQLQPFANLILKVDGNWVKYAIPGVDTPTHGFAATPTLLPRTFNKDGDWDYTPETGLVPNFSGTGSYKISTIDQRIHKFVNKIPCRGTTSFFTITSEESSWLVPGYYLEIVAKNVSNTTWNASVLMECYREKTCIDAV